MITCQACGTENPDGSTYCSNCAMRLDAEVQEALAERRATYDASAVRWPMLIGLLILLIVIVALVAFFVVHGI